MFVRLTLFTSIFALIVIILGAYTRLSDAGLGCPDWPGCYGYATVYHAEDNADSLDKTFPERPLESAKAWKEMIHRYFAGTLGLLILLVAVLAVLNRRSVDQPIFLPLLLVGLVGFQAALGMWTVTLMLKPLVVMGHLLGGMTILSILWWLSLRNGRLFYVQDTAIPIGLRNSIIFWSGVALLVVIMQISLGGWTSANYAALHCPDFPTCQGSWMPPTNFNEAFTLWHENGVNYQYGAMSNEARVTIHIMHRIGALTTFCLLSWLSFRIVRNARDEKLRKMGLVIAAILLLQVSLGITNVLASLPLLVAVAHNAVAALLLLSIVTLNHMLRPRSLM